MSDELDTTKDVKYDERLIQDVIHVQQQDRRPQLGPIPKPRPEDNNTGFILVYDHAGASSGNSRSRVHLNGVRIFNIPRWVSNGQPYLHKTLAYLICCLW